jgi:hypothetical protein
MGEDEKRAIRANALLEYEDAKAELALLTIKAAQWEKLHEKVHFLLARMRRDSAHLEAAATEILVEISNKRAALSEVMNLDAVLALDTELQKAVGRLKKAETAKKALGFN